VRVRLRAIILLAVRRNEQDRPLPAAPKVSGHGFRSGSSIQSHDLNNNLGVILGRCELLSEAIGPNNGLTKHIRAIELAARRIQKIIEYKQS
jgi:hypothetical protein